MTIAAISGMGWLTLPMVKCDAVHVRRVTRVGGQWKAPKSQWLWSVPTTSQSWLMCVGSKMDFTPMWLTRW